MSAGAAQQAAKLDWISIMTSGGPVGIALSVLLVVLSIITWGVIIERWITLGNLHRRSEIFLRSFWHSNDFAQLYSQVRAFKYSPAREVFREGYEEMVRVYKAKKKSHRRKLNFDTVRRALARSRSVEEGQLHRYMSVLAIAASACPFIGLFGTVIGIIRAFHDIGASGSTSLAAVAPGISEALAATALGLVSAIPAVIFYNLLNARMRKHTLLLEAFSADFLNIVERSVDFEPEGGGGTEQQAKVA